ncbi:hypothetical protein ABH940_003173 [Streptacidiphilus sp. BW17]|uniref:hypothetical protein n=1 Tax=unclassified Streptacidiphilus TaxID=2643834 RepID=UPI003511B194
MNAIADRLRDLVAEVTTFEEDWEDKLHAALPTYDPDREGFPVEPQDEVRYFELCDDRAAEARDQLQRTTIGIERVIVELTPQPF